MVNSQWDVQETQHKHFILIFKRVLLSENNAKQTIEVGDDETRKDVPFVLTIPNESYI